MRNKKQGRQVRLFLRRPTPDSAKVRKTGGAWLGLHVYLAAMLPEEYVALFSRPVSKQEVIRLAEHILHHPDEVAALLPVVEEFRPNISWRGGWVLATLGEMGFQGPPGYLKRLIGIVAETPDATVARGALRGIYHIKPDLEEEGNVADACLRWLDMPGTPISTALFAGELMLGLCVRYPEMWHELQPRLERLSENTAPGFRVLQKRAQVVFKKSIAPKLYGSAR